MTDATETLRRIIVDAAEHELRYHVRGFPSEQAYDVARTIAAEVIRALPPADIKVVQ